MTLISQETLKELEEYELTFDFPQIPKEELKQLIHAAKVARVAVKLKEYADHFNADQVDCTCGLSGILKELDELEKE